MILIDAVIEGLAVLSENLVGVHAAFPIQSVNKRGITKRTVRVGVDSQAIQRSFDFDTRETVLIQFVSQCAFRANHRGCFLRVGNAVGDGGKYCAVRNQLEVLLVEIAL